MKGNKTELSFICIGFQKCGTTSLYDLLKQHSDIYLTEDVKEPIINVYNRILEEVSLRPVVKNTMGPASFGHIMSSMYACGYYGYLWSLVYSCDIFSIFKEKGIYNQEEGTRLREMVLSKGASERSAKVLRAYLQREPKMDAFLEEMGLRQWAVCLRSESVCGLLCGV